MKTFCSWFLRSLIVLLSIAILLAQTASAGLIIVVPAAHKPKVKHAPGWTPPADAPPAENDASDEQPITIDSEAIPSATMQPFLDTHLDKILAPLGSPAFTQPDIVAGIRDAFAKSLPAAPEARKPAYVMAVATCNTLIEAIAARQAAVDALNKSYENRRSEAVQPRGGKQAVQDANKDEAFFYESQKNNWKDNAALLRQRIAVAYQRERVAETQAGDWPTPRPISVAVPPPNPTPGPSAQDPVVGEWKLHGESPITLGADNSIHGSREGRWVYTSTTDEGRHYELRWKNKKWTDYMVLSADGKQLEGRSRGKSISATRS